MGRKSVTSKGGGSGDPRRRDQGPWQRQGEGGGTGVSGMAAGAMKAGPVRGPCAGRVGLRRWA